MNTVDEIKEAIYKNKKRLAIELRESKELVFLIKKSLTTPLNTEEKAKVKSQTLDICKAIPAFTIFMLPGGALLLPLLIKLIPDILPSAFKADDKELKDKQEV
ncbi:LETM1 domain-containing protein [Tenacibaculum tangerinum]|uniref:LETM1 domain-containing protein n=1 Tax=Tenacibaculum tangerinum TaxID=3038772 RepID=A0ABY8L352_9FLAO|nr:LETM1 domain-containing protein [Tenacibaculum tangerinum]WGH75694.1 LETM1 domain-containing protein [Tenacibaculum tangerinum]